MQHAAQDLTVGKPPLFRIGKDNSPKLLMLTVQQVVKDFGMLGYPLRYSGKPEDAYEQLYRGLQLVVKESLEDGYDSLLQLLRKIGIEEELLEKFGAHEFGEAEVIASLILEKEFMKVYKKESLISRN